MKKNSFIKLIVSVTFILIGVLFVNSPHADAKKYTFVPSSVTQIKMSNGYLVMKTDSSAGIKSGKTSKKRIKIKVGSTCIWKQSYFSRSDGSSSSNMSSFSKIKKAIKSERKSYVSYGYSSNVGVSSFKVENGKIVLFDYFMMY